MEELTLNSALTITALIFGAVAANPLVRFNIWLYRKLHLTGFAQFWERQIHWWVPVVRVACISGVVIIILSSS